MNNGGMGFYTQRVIEVKNELLIDPPMVTFSGSGFADKWGILGYSDGRLLFMQSK
mgnify:CR=1 FL=1